MPLYYYTDYTMLILIPAVVLAFFAQYKINASYSKYLKVISRRGFTGREVARTILDRHGLSSVEILPIKGQLTDHYDPISKKVSLSEGVYNNNSIAALAIAAHEVGHAIQHQENYKPLLIRDSLVPTVNFSSHVVWILVMLGLILSRPSLVQFGIILFCVIVLFQIITLPVEINASRRALIALSEGGFVDQEEYNGAKKVLSAAALTYIASTLMAVSQLIRLLILQDRNRRS